MAQQSTLSLYNAPNKYPANILYKSIAGRYRPVRVADGPITARYRFIKNAYWVHIPAMMRDREIIEFIQCINNRMM